MHRPHINTCNTNKVCMTHCLTANNMNHPNRYMQNPEMLTVLYLFLMRFFTSCGSFVGLAVSVFTGFNWTWLPLHVFPCSVILHISDSSVLYTRTSNHPERSIGLKLKITLVTHFSIDAQAERTDWGACKWREQDTAVVRAEATTYFGVCGCFNGLRGGQTLQKHRNDSFIWLDVDFRLQTWSKWSWKLEFCGIYSHVY